MPKGEIICEGCGQYESECRCKPKPMTEQELRIKLNAVVGQIKYAEVVEHSIGENEWTNQILALVKQAGYKSPEEAIELNIWSVDDDREIDRAVWAKANGYVKLADNQALPPSYIGDGFDYKRGQQDMLKGDTTTYWAKVRREVKDDRPKED